MVFLLISLEHQQQRGTVKKTKHPNNVLDPVEDKKKHSPFERHPTSGTAPFFKLQDASDTLWSWTWSPEHRRDPKKIECLKIMSQQNGESNSMGVFFGTGVLLRLVWLEIDGSHLLRRVLFPFARQPIHFFPPKRSPVVFGVPLGFHFFSKKVTYGLRGTLFLGHTPDRLTC